MPSPNRSIQSLVELACRYADGTRVACMCISGLIDGRIAWQRGLQAWDH